MVDFLLYGIVPDSGLVVTVFAVKKYKSFRHHEMRIFLFYF